MSVWGKPGHTSLICSVVGKTPSPFPFPPLAGEGAVTFTSCNAWESRPCNHLGSTVELTTLTGAQMNWSKNMSVGDLAQSFICHCMDWERCPLHRHLRLSVGVLLLSPTSCNGNTWQNRPCTSPGSHNRAISVGRSLGVPAPKLPVWENCPQYSSLLQQCGQERDAPLTHHCLPQTRELTLLLTSYRTQESGPCS